ncbi:MAG: DUF2007 domain-containing protein [Flavobacteriaceae bacterium]|nr:DUF2007 domain-containing protein [Flavobacteriaceae bacterium]
MQAWKLLLSFTYPHEAHMAQNLLDSYGIETQLRDELTVQVNNFYSNAIGGVKLFVGEADFDRSLQLLEDEGYIEPAGTPEKEVGIFAANAIDKSSCPYCGSKNIGVLKEPNSFSILLLFVVHAWFPFFKRTYTCYDCEKRWKIKN